MKNRNPNRDDRNRDTRNRDTRKNRLSVCFLIFSLILSMMTPAFPTTIHGKTRKKGFLTPAKKTIYVGQILKIKTRKHGKKLKWIVNSKTVSVVHKTQNQIKVASLRPGKCVIKAKVGKKIHKCILTIKKRENTATAKPEEDGSTSTDGTVDETSDNKALAKNITISQVPVNQDNWNQNNIFSVQNHNKEALHIKIHIFYLGSDNSIVKKNTFEIPCMGANTTNYYADPNPDLTQGASTGSTSGSSSGSISGSTSDSTSGSNSIAKIESNVEVVGDPLYQDLAGQIDVTALPNEDGTSYFLKAVNNSETTLAGADSTLVTIVFFGKNGDCYGGENRTLNLTKPKDAVTFDSLPLHFCSSNANSSDANTGDTNSSDANTGDTNTSDATQKDQTMIPPTTIKASVWYATPEG